MSMTDAEFREQHARTLREALSRTEGLPQPHRKRIASLLKAALHVQPNPRRNGSYLALMERGRALVDLNPGEAHAARVELSLPDSQRTAHLVFPTNGKPEMKIERNTPNRLIRVEQSPAPGGNPNDIMLKRIDPPSTLKAFMAFVRETSQQLGVNAPKTTPPAPKEKRAPPAEKPRAKPTAPASKTPKTPPKDDAPKKPYLGREATLETIRRWQREAR
ncbi:MAG: hypothetical protein V1708_01645 [Candidatus Micrarchaeota archaeon]